MRKQGISLNLAIRDSCHTSVEKGFEKLFIETGHA